MAVEKHNIIQEKSYDLALKVIDMVKKLPRNTEGFIVGNQFGRAGTAVGANVEEAIGAFSKDDFIYKMSIALKEARETHYWLRLIRDSKLIASNDIDLLISETEEVKRILGAIIKSSRS